MNSSLFYKDYGAQVVFDKVDRLFVDHLAGIRDVVGFHGTSLDELENAFHEAVDDYLAHCEAQQIKTGIPQTARS